MNVETLLTDLKKISDVSGNEFLALSSSFPVLIKELNRGAGSSGASAQDKVGDLAVIKQHLLELITNQTHVLERDRAFLGSFRKKNDDLFRSLTEKMESLSEMNDLILKIKDASMEMEIISLNAMIVSIKSGKEGHAFSYITENLKRLSLQLITQSDKLISFEDNVQKNIDALKGIVETVSSAAGSAETAGDTSFAAILDAIDLMSNAVNTIVNLAGQVKRPILQAMESIQIQDIIRQSLDDVILTVAKITIPNESLETDQRLDQYSFNFQLSELAVSMLTQIGQRLAETIMIFKENREAVNDILADVEERRSQFIQKFLGGGEDNAFNVQNLIMASIGDFEVFMKDVQVYQTSQGKVLEKSLAIQSEVFKMQSCFEDFFPIITNLQYVAIAQRIEVARNSAIESIHSTVEYMSELIVQTNGNVESAESRLQDFIDSSNTLIQNFSREAATSKKRFASIRDGKTEFITNLQDVQEQFTNAMTNFNVYSRDFLTVYDSIANSIGELETLENDIDRIEDSLRQVMTQSQKEKAELMSNLDIEEWNIHNHSFTDFINHFTIVSDKQAAGKLAGFAIESGAAAGEITLF